MTFPDTTLDRRAWEMTHEGDPVSKRAEKAQVHKDRLKGVQLKFGGGPLAYRAESLPQTTQCSHCGDGLQIPLHSFEATCQRCGSFNMVRAKSSVLCDRHLDLRRGRNEAWRLSGDAFPATACDDCAETEDEMERSRR